MVVKIKKNNFKLHFDTVTWVCDLSNGAQDTTL